MRFLGSFVVHVVIAFILFSLCGAILWSVIVGILPRGMVFDDRWFWYIWGGISLIIAYFTPAMIAKRRIQHWTYRLASPRGKAYWERGSRAILSWLDASLLWPWERNRLAPRTLDDIEPYLRSEIPETDAYRNLLKLLLRYEHSDPEYRELLIDSYLTQGISSLDDAAMISDLWDDEQPEDKLGKIWVGFALAQKIDAPWMEKGYRWALDQEGGVAEQVTRFLLPKMMSRHRHDDLAALVYLEARGFEASPELDRALLRIAQYHFRTSRDDELSDRIRDAVAEVKIEEGVEIEEEVDLDTLIAKVKPTFGGFVWRNIQAAFQFIFRLIGAAFRYLLLGIGTLFQVLWQVFRRTKVSAGAKRWLYPAAIGLSVVIIGWVIFQIIPPVSEESSSQDRGVMKVYHSDLLFTVQIAAFRNPVEAENMTMALRLKGEEAYWQKSDGEKPWYRVRIGGFETQESAKKYAEDLISRELIENYYIANFSDGYYKNP